ncbi:MAG TPA: hypothetical protein VGU46_09310 [Acidobacteriaceae bacterium]|nr:hypothetical protein [Acidobacteriaceae bacterium]
MGQPWVCGHGGFRAICEAGARVQLLLLVLGPCKGPQAARGWGAAAPAQAGATSAERVGRQRQRPKGRALERTRPDDGTEEGAKARPPRQRRREHRSEARSACECATSLRGRDAGTIAAKDLRRVVGGML